MKDEKKTKEQLIHELVEMRQRIAELEARETERKRAEEAIRALKEFKQSVLQSIRDGLVAVDGDFRITFWNNAMESITGYPGTEVVGKIKLDVFPHLNEHGVDELLRAALEGRTVERSNIPYQTRKGVTVYTNNKFLPRRNQAREVIGVLAIVEDVTERLLQEQQLTHFREEISRRKLVEIAKGILMRERGLSEAESYQFIQKSSRDECKKMGETAKQIIRVYGSRDERKKLGLSSFR